MNRQAEEASALADDLHKKLYVEKTEEPEARDDDTVIQAVESLENVVEPVKDDTPLVEPVVDYEAKFKVLQGKYNAEVPRLSKEIREAKSTIQSMQTQLDELKESPAPVAKDLEITDLNPEAYAEYGEEFETLAKMVKQLTGQVNSLVTENTYLKDSLEGVENTQNQKTSDDFILSLEGSVPDWETINRNADFIQWLQEVDTISGVTRQVHLDDAAETLNARKAISIFKEFNDSVAPSSANNTQQHIARQAQPASVQSPAPTSEAKRFYTRSELKQFYKEVALVASGKGPWVGREAEVKAIEADIFAAPREGRIIG